MWIMTSIGFFSIVEKPKGYMCIRSRILRDLERFQHLIPGSDPIVRTRMSDYRYRTFMPRERFEKEFFRFSKLITYDNFKDEVKRHNPRREKLYHKVWADLLAIESEEKNGRFVGKSKVVEH
jgi:hypothetical protein